MKICKKCKIEKPDNQYYKSKNNSDSLRGSCIECCKKKRESFTKIESKKCIGCNIKYDINKFWKNNLRKDGYGSYCKKCDTLKTTKFKINSYGLTINEHLELLKTQDYKCAICAKVDDYKSLSIDHDHVTGKVRGLLCQKCNSGLGLFCDKTELLLMAATYLESNKY